MQISALHFLHEKKFGCEKAGHSSEIRGLCSRKCSSKRLQNLLYFMYKKTHVVFSFFLSSCNFILLPYECPGLCCTKWKTKKTTWVFLYIKYSKFWSVLLEHFVERKPLISEEWIGFLDTRNQPKKWLVFSTFFCHMYLVIFQSLRTVLLCTLQK